MSLDAVLFDLDGTLVRRTQDIDAVYEAAFERVGVAPFGEPAALWDSLDGPPDPDDRVGYLGVGFARLAARRGRTGADPLDLAAALVDGVDDSQVALLEGAEAALAAAQEAGAVGILTNGPERRQAEKAAATGLDDRIDPIVYAGDLPRRKPHAAPFEAALAAFEETVAPGSTLYVGDSLNYDVAGAHNADLQAAWLDDGDGPGEYDPEHVLPSIGDLPEVLS